MYKRQIVNDSEKDWNLQSIISGKGFSGVNKIHVSKGEKVNYTLSFMSPYADTVDGALVLRDQTTNETFEYKLRGIADDPLAEDHLVFKCTARNKTTFKIPLHQIPRKPVPAQSRDARLHRPQSSHALVQTFKVETDVPYVSGDPTVDVEMTGGEYSFVVMCPAGGILAGSFTFTDVESGALVWYTV